MKQYCIGIDVGGTTVKLGLFQLHEGDGTLLEKWEVPTRKEDGGAHILPDVAASILEHLSQRGITTDELEGAGIGVPGPVTPDGYVPVCVNLGWQDRYPARELSPLLGGCRVCVSNDANVAALGELWKGCAAGSSNVVLLTLGTGVGGGVIMDGHVIDGTHGAGGELGHVIVNPEEPEQCNCGSHGCLEQYASATGVVRVAKRLLASTELASALREKETFSAKDVFDLAKAEDPLAKEAVDVLCRYLGLATANCALTVDPEVFVIGGGVSRAGEILTDGIGRYFAKFTPILKQKAQFRIATLGNDAGIYGSARLVL